MTKRDTPRLAPDGVEFIVDWDKFTPNTSVFVPCINYKRAIDHIVEVSGILRVELVYRVRIENGLYGVRVWRVTPPERTPTP